MVSIYVSGLFFLYSLFFILLYLSKAHRGPAITSFNKLVKESQVPILNHGNVKEHLGYEVKHVTVHAHCHAKIPLLCF